MKENENYVLVFFDEQDAMLNEVRPGWNLVDCAGNNNLKMHFLLENLTSEDKQELAVGKTTLHSAELLEDVGIEIDEIIITYSYEHRQYEIEIVERNKPTKTKALKSAKVAYSAGRVTAYRYRLSNRVRNCRRICYL